MKSHRTTTLAAGALLAAGLIASPALGQQGPMAHGMMGGDHGGMMMAAMAFGPGPMMLLHQKEALGLTDDQASRLDSLRAAMHGTMEEHRAGMEEHHQEMKGLASSQEPAMDRLRDLLEGMAEAHVELAMEMASTHRQAMDVLSEEQRSNARYGMKLMHRMMPQHGGRAGHGEMMKMMEGQSTMLRRHGGEMGMEREAGVQTWVQCDPVNPAEGGGR